jgi:CubicO group peptidase (beta-lactamase class C family)
MRILLTLAVNIVSCCALVHAHPTHSDAGVSGQGLVLRNLSEHPTLASIAEGWERIPKDFSTSGLAVVVLDGDTAYTWFAGERDPGSGLPIDADTMFYIASNTKTYTATALAMLDEEGVVDLHSPVQKYLPEFDLRTKRRAREMTVEDLLTHRAALDVPYATLLESYSGEMTDERFYELAETYGKSRRMTRYSNANINTAARVLERATGETWDEYLADKVFEPLGLNRTTADATAAYLDSNIAYPAVRDPKTGTYIRASYKTTETMHPAGGLVTTPRDAAKWLRHAIGRGPQLLTQSTSARSQSIIGETEDSSIGYGYGWVVGKLRGQTIIRHDGRYIGAYAHYAALPKSDRAVAVFLNTSGPEQVITQVIRQHVFDAFAGEPLDEGPQGIYQRAKAHVDENGPSASEPLPHPIPVGELVGGVAAAGVYEHKLFGTLRIVPESGAFRVYLGGLELDASPTRKGFSSPRLDARFKTNRRGNIDAIRVDFKLHSNARASGDFTRTEPTD